MLTDSYGLGKTTEAILAAETPCLVACPGHMLSHWRREIAACLPNAVVKVAEASDFVTRKRQLGGQADFYVCNIELLRTGLTGWFEPLRQGAIKTFVVDEAHRLRGRNSQQTLGATQIAHVVERVYLLTASPVYNQPNDLYSLLHMLDKARFGSYWRFVDAFLLTLQTPWGPKILGLRKDKTLLRVFKEYALGRTRAQVRAQLPPVQHTLVEVTPDAAWYNSYSKARVTHKINYDGTLTSRMSILQDLRGMTQQAKLQAVCQLISDNDCEQHTLIYTYHKDLARAVGSLLSLPVVTGDMPAAQREAAVKGAESCVATFPSIAEGLDLSHMQNVIFMEHDWQAGMLEQAINRVHRPGNLHDSVQIYHVVVPKTIDAHLYNVSRARGATMEEIVNAVLADVDDISIEAVA